MSFARLGLATGVLYLVLIQPNHPAALSWGALGVFPLELPVILAALVVLGAGRAGAVLRAALVAALVAIALLKLADFGTFIAFNRGFNLVADYNLLPAAWDLTRGSIGLLPAVLAVAGGGVLVVALVVALWWATGVFARMYAGPLPRVAAAVLFVPALALAVAEIGQARRAWSLPPALRAVLPGAAFTARVGLERVEQIRTTRADLARFRLAAQEDSMRDTAPHFDRLGQRDFVLAYVESYGRSSFDNPLYSPTHTATLRGIEQDLTARGLSMRSGWARAPMVGGQSWLAHGSVASGLWLDTQARYRALIASPRQTLFHYAQQAGRRTVAIKPAHIFPWPEGDYFGFDAIYNAADLGYQGQPFNWVTMPDQFTLHALDRLERDRTDRTPLVVQVALVSSHAPWVPIPELVDWDAIGTGTIFDQWALSGDPPDVVWRDHDRVRDQFRLAVDYSLQTMGDWIARHADTSPLVVMLGDHEPARFVSGVEGFDVPVHVIGPADLVDQFASLDWTEGMIPAPQTPSIRMDALRDVLLSRLGSGAASAP
ncbi:sulfatase-like hydrolase/transferase [Roseinatronobacter sp. NSM]|uniref:sulfatase-like hydrolase/transferase n=1 Tax=Roseinatronobacter sp. NSM TaxID=3457785 RepID=UPI0040352A6B